MVQTTVILARYTSFAKPSYFANSLAIVPSQFNANFHHCMGNAPQLSRCAQIHTHMQISVQTHQVNGRVPPIVFLYRLVFLYPAQDRVAVSVVLAVCQEVESSIGFRILSYAFSFGAIQYSPQGKHQLQWLSFHLPLVKVAL